MFTGLVQSLGRVESLDGPNLVISAEFDAWPDEPFALGESVAVNGVCLTLVKAAGGRLSFEVSPETFQRTTLGTFAAGRTVNLERALRLGDRLGGHMVQGHVDAVGEVVSLRASGDFWDLECAVPEAGARYLVDKGSITVDGISLTVVEPAGNRFRVAVVPHTWTHTNLHSLSAGDAVNLEYDVLMRHVENLLRFR